MLISDSVAYSVCSPVIEILIAGEELDGLLIDDDSFRSMDFGWFYHEANETLASEPPTYWGSSQDPERSLMNAHGHVLVEFVK